MKFLSSLVISFIANGAGLYIAGVYVPGFSITPNLRDVAIAAAILTGINLVVRPILKHILWPLMILTIGLFGIVINALTLYVLDYFLPYITISGLIPLIYATLIITAANIAVGIVAKIL
ncbi:MAG: phage holin family protein [Patescibacteria group bacterium]|nr:phage holin family protein [Patescibacteria group bacterium]